MIDKLKTTLRALAQKLSIDKAIGYAVLTRFWQLIAGPVTSLLIAFWFMPETQGVYYLFLSLIGFQVVAELGFHWVIVHLIAHASAELTTNEDGQLSGDAHAIAEVASLFRAAQKWFRTASVIYTGIVIGIGYFLIDRQDVELNWLPPWLALAAASGFGLSLTPYMATLEGCGQMRVVNTYRFWQTLLGNIVVWCAITLGAGLWVPFWSTMTQVGVEMLVIWRRYAKLWPTLVGEATASVWQEKIWPLQWRVGVLSVSHWFAFSLIVPLTFEFAGAIVGGQIGMTWTILLAFQTMAFAWVRYRFADFGRLIARREFIVLNTQFRTLTIISSAVLATLLVSFLTFVWLLETLDHQIARRLSERLLDFSTTSILATSILFFHFVHCWKVYVRSHRQEPYLRLTLGSNFLLGAVFFAGIKYYGLAGGALGILGTILFVHVPVNYWIFCWFRKAIASQKSGE